MINLDQTSTHLKIKQLIADWLGQTNKQTFKSLMTRTKRNAAHHTA